MIALGLVCRFLIEMASKCLVLTRFQKHRQVDFLGFNESMVSRAIICHSKIVWVMEQKERSTYQRGTFFFSITFSITTIIIIFVIIIIISIIIIIIIIILFRVFAKVAGAIRESALVFSMAKSFASLAKQSPVSRPFGHVAEY